MNELWGWAALMGQKVFRMLTGERFVSTVLCVFAFIVLVEVVTARRWRRYLTRTFLTDLTYFFFFTAGIYYFLFSGPVERLAHWVVTTHLQSLVVDVYGWLPVGLKALAFIMTIDFCEWCMHRLGHANKWYWKFHCIHHTPETLTPLSKFRIHWADMLVFGTFKAIPILLLGHMGVTWMPYLPLGLLQIFSHFDVNIHYGPVLGRFLVSPRYHRVHHSADPAQQNTNFGIIFSCWDYIFGTANADLTRPKQFGLREPKVPDSFAVQFFYPFLLVGRGLGLGGPRPQAEGEVRPAA
jgi:sterol desaturase/sphingolipid hydroxylase (fatty acid hydroxylase superfamily)